MISVAVTSKPCFLRSRQTARPDTPSPTTSTLGIDCCAIIAIFRPFLPPPVPLPCHGTLSPESRRIPEGGYAKTRLLPRDSRHGSKASRARRQSLLLFGSRVPSSRALSTRSVLSSRSSSQRRNEGQGCFRLTLSSLPE